MKRMFLWVIAGCMMLLMAGCGSAADKSDSGVKIVATTYPVYYLTDQVVGEIDGISVEVLIQEPVSCLHNYSISTTQMMAIDEADVVVLSGAGLEDFLNSALSGFPKENIVDSSVGIALNDGDPHIWMDPEKAAWQAENIAAALGEKYPRHREAFEENAAALKQQLLALKQELGAELQSLSTRSMVTFHDGFGYFAEAFGLTIAAAVEEEEGAEASAKELEAICNLIEEQGIPAIFNEKNGSTNASNIISRETGAAVYTLDMMMDGTTDYMTAMRENVLAVKEALG